MSMLCISSCMSSFIMSSSICSFMMSSWNSSLRTQLLWWPNLCFFSFSSEDTSSSTASTTKFLFNCFPFLSFFAIISKCTSWMSFSSSDVSSFKIFFKLLRNILPNSSGDFLLTGDSVDFFPDSSTFSTGLSLLSLQW